MTNKRDIWGDDFLTKPSHRPWCEHCQVFGAWAVVSIILLVAFTLSNWLFSP